MLLGNHVKGRFLLGKKLRNLERAGIVFIKSYSQLNEGTSHEGEVLYEKSCIDLISTSINLLQRHFCLMWDLENTLF